MLDQSGRDEGCKKEAHLNSNRLYWDVVHSRDGISKAFSFPDCLKVQLKSAFLKTMYLGCVWKWIKSREQNVPERGRASL